jgi:hypothetical protein
MKIKKKYFSQRQKPHLSNSLCLAQHEGREINGKHFKMTGYKVSLQNFPVQSLKLLCNTRLYTERGSPMIAHKTFYHKKLFALKSIFFFI